MENNEIQDEMIEVTLTDQNGEEYKVYLIWQIYTINATINIVDYLLSVNTKMSVHMLTASRFTGSYSWFLPLSPGGTFFILIWQ